MTDYGPFAGTVADVAALVAFVVALSLGFRGRAKWEPAEVDIDDGPQKVVGVVCAGLVALLWTTARDPSAIPLLHRLIIGGIIVVIFSLVAYSFIISVHIYKKEVLVTQDDGELALNEFPIIGGFLLTPAARSKLAQDSNLTIQDLLKGALYEPDLVWTRPSRAAAKITFILAYLALTVSGTLLLASSGILVELTQAASGDIDNRSVLPVDSAATLRLLRDTMKADGR